jgi:hypothetical protein
MRLFNSRMDALPMVRFPKAEHAYGCLFGTGFAIKEICRRSD